MSFGGHVMAMIAMIKNNARPKRRTLKNLADHYEKYKNARFIPIREKSISNSQLKKLKEN